MLTLGDFVSVLLLGPPKVRGHEAQASISRVGLFPKTLGLSVAASVGGGSLNTQAMPPCCLTSPHVFLFPFVFLLQTSSSAVVLSSQGLLPSSPPSPPLTFDPPPPTESSPEGHTPEVLSREGNSQVLLPLVAPRRLDLVSLEGTSVTQNSRCPSMEGSQQSFDAKSQALVRNDLMESINEPFRTPLGHTLHPAVSTGSQGPLASDVCSEEIVAPIWRWPQAVSASRPEIPHGVTYSFQEGTEPAIVAVDRQAVLPDTWSLTKECGQQEQAQSEPGGPESSYPAPADKEQLGGKIPWRGSLGEPTQALQSPKNPEGATKAALEARKEEPEFPHAVVMGTPTTSERISTAGQAGTSLSNH